MSQLVTYHHSVIQHDFDGAIISVSHDRKYIDEVCDKVYQIKNNQMMLIQEKK